MMARRGKKLVFSGAMLCLAVGVFLLLLLAHLAGVRCFASLHSATSEVLGATSNYVLPYPSFMPGHRLYRVGEILDVFQRFWAFGSFASHKYELGMADKKLVEAKTLFEYQQYFLATQSLAESNQHWQKAVDYLKKAQDEGKDISQKLANFQTAAEKHREVLEKLKEDLPEEFLWQPEKQDSEKLMIGRLLDEAIDARRF